MGVYHIESEEDLYLLEEHPKSEIHLDNNIEVDNHEWSGDEVFSGELYGNGNKVSINHSIDSLFPSLKDAVVKDLVLNTMVSITETKTTIGGLAREAEKSKIGNCRVMGYIKSRFNLPVVGGIVGKCKDTLVYDSSCSAEINKTVTVGGIVGELHKEGNSKIENCTFEGDIHNSTGAGSIIGYNEGVVNNCISKGSIYGFKSGGLVSKNNGIIKNSYFFGNSKKSNPALAYSNFGILKNCRWDDRYTIPVEKDKEGVCKNIESSSNEEEAKDSILISSI